MPESWFCFLPQVCDDSSEVSDWVPLCDYAPEQCLSVTAFAGLASVVAPPDGTVHDYVMVDVISGSLPVNWSIVFKENGMLYKNKISGQTQADHPLLALRSVRTRHILVL